MMGHDSVLTNKGFTQSPADYLFIFTTPIQLETISSSSLMSAFASQTRRNSLKFRYIVHTGNGPAALPREFRLLKSTHGGWNSSGLISRR